MAHEANGCKSLRFIFVVLAVAVLAQSSLVQSLSLGICVNFNFLGPLPPLQGVVEGIMDQAVAEYNKQFNVADQFQILQGASPEFYMRVRFRLH